MMITKKWRFRDYIGILILLLLIASVIRTSILGSHQGTTLINDMRAQYRLIDHLSTDRLVKYSEDYSGDNASILSIYKSTLSYDEILKYYESELEAHGWTFLGEKKVQGVFEKYTEEVQATFQKGNYVIDLDFAGQDPSNNWWTYGLYVHWQRQE